MKAVGYFSPRPIHDPEALVDVEIPEPALGEYDLLVDVKAVSVNPIDYKVRRSRAAEGSAPVILGWDAAGVVRQLGRKATGFAVGDEVFYAGDLMRQGSNAERQAVDFRLVAKKPKLLSFADAAALPLTTLTAYEALFEKLRVPKAEPCDVLIIGGAGGVGSIAVQLLKVLTKSKVYATYGREASLKWLKGLHVDYPVDRRQSLAAQVRTKDLPEFPFVFVTTHTEQYLEDLLEITQPFGGMCFIDSPASLDAVPFVKRSLSLHWELMFTKSLCQFRQESQGRILQEVAALVDSGQIRSTAQTAMRGLKASNFIEAHKVLESGEAVGKITVTF